jgi:hypothetical protein
MYWFGFGFGLCYNGTAWRVWHQLTHWNFIISQKELIQLLLSTMTARQIMQERKYLRTFLPILLTLSFVPSWHWVATSASTKRLSVLMTRSFRRKGRMVLLRQHTAVSRAFFFCNLLTLSMGIQGHCTPTHMVSGRNLLSMQLAAQHVHHPCLQ